MDFANLKPGVTIDIQRTDGRIHSAIISSINVGNSTVTVEWLEKNETKGKEIDLDDVKSLNSELFHSTPQQQSLHQQQVNNNKKLLNGGAEGLKTGSRETVKGSKRPSTSAAPNNCISRPNKVSLNERDRGEPTSIISTAATVVATTTTGHSSSVNTTVTAGNNSNNTNVSHLNSAAPDSAMMDNGQDDPKKNNFRRKSNCVKEVEKIKQRRNERRAQQMAIKEQNETEFDTNLPNWEFEAMIREFRKTLDFRPLTNSEPVECHQICVCVRKRPLNKKELDRKEVDVITVPNKDIVIIHEPKTKVDLTKYVENQTFRFDYSFDENSTNDIVYRYTARPLVECTFAGGMSTCFAYGQTGSGKTHTMGGDFSGGKGKQDCSKGIYVLAASDVFKLMHSKYRDLDLMASASFFEIYSGKVFDLLNQKQKLRVLEDGKQQVQIVGLKEEEMNRVEDVMRLIHHGNLVRTSGQTSANNHSSRSHAVFQIVLRKRSNRKLHGKFSLIDLAGNERGVDTMDSERQTRLEGAEINKSLLALKECIRALGRRGAHLPFRASKLTQVLRDSFIGENSKTCMIAMISPGMNCCEHTLNTLRYADRVKELGPGGIGDSKYDNSALSEMSPQKSDLALLRNANEEELSEELYEFHEIVDNMQEVEEVVVDEHRDLLQKQHEWMEMDSLLLKMTDEVDYDLEAYAKELDSLIDLKIHTLQNLKEKVTHLRQDLAREDQLSKNIKTGK